MWNLWFWILLSNHCLIGVPMVMDNLIFLRKSINASTTSRPSSWIQGGDVLYISYAYVTIASITSCLLFWLPDGKWWSSYKLNHVGLWLSSFWLETGSSLPVLGDGVRELSAHQSVMWKQSSVFIRSYLQYLVLVTDMRTYHFDWHPCCLCSSFNNIEQNNLLLEDKKFACLPILFLLQ